MPARPNERSLLARPEDGMELLRILESSPAKGAIELLYTRRPDAYASYGRECGESRVFVSRDGDRIVGTCAEIIREVYIGGEPARAAYLCGLKKDADYPSTVGWGSDFFRTLVREDIDCYYCSVVSDNHPAQDMFGRASRLMEMRPLGRYTTHILTPGFTLKAEPRHCRFRQAAQADTEAVLRFLNAEGRRYDLFPVVTSLADFYGLSAEDFFLLEQDGEIVAAGALWDQTAYKQYVVKKYRGLLRWARLLNPILPRLGYIRLPQEDEALRFPMLSFFLTKGEDAELCKIFLNRISREVAKRYEMFVIGVPHSHFAAPILSGIRGLRFDTVLHTVRFAYGGHGGRTVDATKLLPECGWL